MESVLLLRHPYTPVALFDKQKEIQHIGVETNDETVRDMLLNSEINVSFFNQ